MPPVMGAGAFIMAEFLVIGVVSITGLGVKFGSTVLVLAGGSTFILLLLTAVICIILGMGLPTTAAYVIAAAVGVSALIKIGIDPLAANLFVFYFGVVSSITPPVCGSVYSACAFS